MHVKQLNMNDITKKYTSVRPIFNLLCLSLECFLKPIGNSFVFTSDRNGLTTRRVGLDPSRKKVTLNSTVPEVVAVTSTFGDDGSTTVNGMPSFYFQYH